VAWEIHDTWYQSVRTFRAMALRIVRV